MIPRISGVIEWRSVCSPGTLNGKCSGLSGPRGQRSPRWVPERHTATGEVVHDGFPKRHTVIGRESTMGSRTRTPHGRYAGCAQAKDRGLEHTHTHDAFSKAEANFTSSIHTVGRHKPSQTKLSERIALSPSSIDRLHIPSRNFGRMQSVAFLHACIL